MFITRSISVAQTDDRVLEAGSPRDKQSDRSIRYLILFHRLSETKSVSTINTQFSIAIIDSKLNTSFLVSRWFKPHLFK